MQKDTFHAVIRAFKGRQPFRPILIELKGGDNVLVDNPEALAFNGPSVVYIPPNGAIQMFGPDSVVLVTEAPNPHIVVTSGG